METFFKTQSKKFHIMKTDNPRKVPITKAQGARSTIHYFGGNIQIAEPAEQQDKFK